MEELSRSEVEQIVLEVLGIATDTDPANYTMETPLEEINLKSMQLISVAALLEEKLGYGPNFRALMGMSKVGDIADYVLR